MDPRALPEHTNIITEMRKLILEKQIPVFDVTNVADYLWRSHEPHDTRDPELLPNLAPPFERFWMEYRRPAVFTHQRDDTDPPGQWIESPTDTWEVQRWGALFHRYDMSQAKNPKPGTRWQLWANLYTLERSGPPIGPVLVWRGDLNERGELLYAVHAVTKGGEKDEDNYLRHHLAFFPMLRALCYLNCRNVEQEIHEPPAKLVKANLKRRGTPLISYRTLVIRPMTAGGGGSRTGGADGTTMRRHHIVRGHFRDYRENGLFGKYKDIYWFDSHVKGDREQGVADKDYAVEPMEDGA
jgi:hypothetical protein